MDKIERIINCLKKYNPDKIILFGSYARKDIDEYSDIDLVAIKKTKKRFLKHLIEVSQFLDDDLGDIDIFVYIPEEFKRMIEWKNPFIENVLKEGKTIYEKK